MAVQTRNSEQIDLLRADFIHKNDSAYTWAMLLNMYSMLPGITAFWPMGAISKDDYLYWGNKSKYDLVNDQVIINPSLAFYLATLLVGKGSGMQSAAVFQGSTYQSHFHYGAQEDIYIRGGIATSKLYLGDSGSGGIQTGTGPFISFNTVGDGWKSFPYTNSGGTTWNSWGAPWQVGEYQKFGDWLMIRGLVARTAGAGMIIGNLPVGYRVTNDVLLGTNSNDALTRLEIKANGDIVAGATYSTWISIWAIVSML